MAMIAAIKFDHNIAAGMGTGQTDGAHGGFSSGIDEANHIKRRQGAAKQLGQFHLQRGGGAKAGPQGGGAADGRHHLRMGMPQNQWPPGADHINKGVAIHISDQATLCLLHKERITPHSTTGPYRRVDAAGNRSPRFCKKPGGIGSIQSGLLRSNFSQKAVPSIPVARKPVKYSEPQNDNKKTRPPRRETGLCARRWAHVQATCTKVLPFAPQTGQLSGALPSSI